MTHTVTEACIKCKYTDCVDVCPADCFSRRAQLFDHRPRRVHRLRGLASPSARSTPSTPKKTCRADQQHMTQLNAELSKLPHWKSITKRKAPLPDADEWKDKTNKLSHPDPLNGPGTWWIHGSHLEPAHRDRRPVVGAGPVLGSFQVFQLGCGRAYSRGWPPCPTPVASCATPVPRQTHLRRTRHSRCTGRERSTAVAAGAALRAGTSISAKWSRIARATRRRLVVRTSALARCHGRLRPGGNGVHRRRRRCVPGAQAHGGGLDDVFMAASCTTHPTPDQPGRAGPGDRGRCATWPWQACTSAAPPRPWADRAAAAQRYAGTPARRLCGPGHTGGALSPTPGQWPIQFVAAQISGVRSTGARMHALDLLYGRRCAGAHSPWTSCGCCKAVAQTGPVAIWGRTLERANWCGHSKLFHQRSGYLCRWRHQPLPRQEKAHRLRIPRARAAAAFAAMQHIAPRNPRRCSTPPPAPNCTGCWAWNRPV